MPQYDDHVEPGTRDAAIGAAFGVLLVFLGSRIPYRILGWPLVGLGALFVVVMTGYALAMWWRTLSTRLRPAVQRLRGRVRIDPQLGTLTRQVKAHAWEAMIPSAEQPIDVVIDGEESPDPALLARAREIVAEFAAIEARVYEYLGREADAAASDAPEQAAEIRGLRIATIILRTSFPAGRVMIDFRGPDEMRYWYCDYDEASKELSDLDYDT